MSAGSDHSLAVRLDGSLWAWGKNSWGQLGDGTSTTRSDPVRIVHKDWSAVFAGDGNSFALKQDGTLWAWGRNAAGQLGDGTRIDRRAPVQVLPR
ncbi:MAG: hypothetical protein KKA32_11285 [Actinobacteria bacterium]|nr:hypothetical protein [Actinomycetota bacterium]